MLLPIFKAISLTFAVAAIGTGLQALIDPIGFSKSFGLVLTSPSHRSLTESYISLMGIRQFATGLILLVFAYQEKWIEMATILGIIGVVVAGTDGLFLARAGMKKEGLFHALPGAIIASLGIAVACNGM